MAGKEDTAPRYRFDPEAPIRAGWLNLDWKLVWKVSFFLLGALATVVSSVVGLLLVGIVFDVLLAVIYLLFVGIQPFERYRKTVLAKLFRSGVQLVAGLLGRNSFVAPEITMGESLGTEPRMRPQPKAIARLGSISFRAFDTDPGSNPPKPALGIAYDKRYRTYSAGLHVAAASILMNKARADGSQLGGLRRLLDDLANVDSSVHRLVWREQTLLGEPQQPDRLFKTLQSGAGLNGHTDLAHTESVKRHLQTMGDEAVIHNTTFMLSVHAPQVQRQVRKLGSIEEVLYQQLATFYSSAMSSGGATSPLGWRSASVLSHAELLWENRLALDPVYAQAYWEEWIRNPLPQMPSEHAAWPNTADFEPVDYCRLGQTYHAEFFVEFPSEDVTLEQLWEIQRVPVPKTVSIVIEMVPAHRARNRARWATSGVLGANSDKAAAHRRTTEEELLTAEEVTQHERNIALRNQVGRMRGYIDVTGASLPDLKANAEQVKKASFHSTCRIEPLDGRQVLGIDAVMPIGRGLAGYSHKWYR